MESQRSVGRALGAIGLVALGSTAPTQGWAKDCSVGVISGGTHLTIPKALADGCDNIEVLRDLGLDDPVTLPVGAVTIWATKPLTVPPIAVPEGAELHLEGVLVPGRALGTVGWDHGCDRAITAAVKRYPAGLDLLAYPSLCVAGGVAFLDSVVFDPAPVAGVGNAAIVVQAGELYGTDVSVSGFSGPPAMIVGPDPTGSSPIANWTGGSFVGNADGAILSDHGAVALDGTTFTKNDSARRGAGADVEAYGGTVIVNGGLFTNAGGADGTPASAFALDATAASIDGVTISGYRAAAGAAIRAKGWATISLSNATLDDLASYLGGAIHVEDPVAVTIEATKVTRTNALTGGVVSVSGGAASSYVELLDLDVTAGFATGASTIGAERGAVLRSEGPTTIRISGGGYTGDPSVVPRVGGAVYVTGAARFEANGTTFAGFTSVDEGGSIFLEDVDDASIAWSYFDESVAGGLGGSVYASRIGWLSVQESWFVGGRGYEGGHLALVDTSFDVVGSLFANGEADQHGGAAYVVGGGSPQRFLASRFCQNTAAVGGGAAFFGSGATGANPDVEISHTAFLRNDDPFVDGVKVVGGQVWMYSDTFVGNGQASGDVLIGMYDNTLGLYNSVMMDADYGVNLGLTAKAYSESWVDSWDVKHPVAFGDPPRDRAPAENHQSFDPLLRGEAGVGGADCFYSVMPDAGSAAWELGIQDELGVPEGLGVYGNDMIRINFDLDFDGYHGYEDCDDGDPAVTDRADAPIPRPSGLADLDQDGAISGVCGGDDCDDLRPDVRPGAVDAEGDALDANCDGVDGVAGCPDGDGDGHGALPCGDDCDDGSASVFPLAPEIELDGVDQDCDGLDGAPWAVGGGGCAVGGAAVGSVVPWILGLALARSRRRSRSVV